MDGFALCREWQKDESLRSIPFVFYTATYTDELDKNFAYKLGAVRYLHKPLKPVALINEIEQVLSAHQQGALDLHHGLSLDDATYFQEHIKTLARKLENKLEDEKVLIRLATTDTLTGVFNRRAFMDFLRHEYARFKRYRQPFSLLMLDIDKFKRINDTCGHPAGDVVLNSLAQHTLAILRETDIFGRWGGDEFAALLVDTTSTGVADVVERLKNHFGEFIVKTENVQIKFSVSIGQACVQETDTSIEEIIKRADKALYADKDRQ